MKFIVANPRFNQGLEQHPQVEKIPVNRQYALPYVYVLEIATLEQFVAISTTYPSCYITKLSYPIPEAPDVEYTLVVVE